MSTRLPVAPAPDRSKPTPSTSIRSSPSATSGTAFRRYLEGLLLPAERNKTLTALANTEPVVGAQHRQAQSLQWFLSESTWEPHTLNAPAPGPAARRSDHRARRSRASSSSMKRATAKMATRPPTSGASTWPISARPTTASSRSPASGPTSASIIRSTLEPYTPAALVCARKDRPGLPHQAADRGVAGGARGCGRLAVPGHRRRRLLWGKRDLSQRTRAAEGRLCPGAQALTLLVASSTRTLVHWRKRPRRQPGTGPEQPGAWEPVVRYFRDGHAETWWALEAVAGPYGPDKAAARQHRHDRSGGVARPDDLVPGYQSAAPGTARAAASTLAPASVAEIVRLYGLRMWVEQSYKQVKHALGWAQYQVRSDLAMRRHWVLVWCAFSFCWWQLGHGAADGTSVLDAPGAAPRRMVPNDAAGREKNQAGRSGTRPRVCWPAALRRVRAWLEPWIMLRRYWRAWSRAAPATGAPGAARLGAAGLPTLSL